jgi:antitoxin component YwqK of YwqJK toxin-antitoxin module
MVQVKKKIVFILPIAVLFLQACPGPYDSYRMLERESRRTQREMERWLVHEKNGMLYGDSVTSNDSLICSDHYERNKITRSSCIWNDTYEDQKKVKFRHGKIKLTTYYKNGHKETQYRNGRWKKWDRNGKREKINGHSKKWGRNAKHLKIMQPYK